MDKSRPVLATENEARAADVGAAVEHTIMRQDDSRRRSVAPGAGHRDTMAESIQSIDGGLGNAVFDHHASGNEFVIPEGAVEVFGLESRCLDRLLRGHTEIDDIEQHL